MAVVLATKQWTIEELHSLPDDGNKYELIHGELFVTPPTDPHETIAARLTRLLDPYVAANDLGEHKREFYTESRIPDYWLIDADERAVIVIRPDAPIEAVTDTLVWHPTGAREPLTIALAPLFDGL